MPRHTHPRPRNKHPRAHTRYQRRRYIGKRWRAAKRRYVEDSWLVVRVTVPSVLEPDVNRLRHQLRQVGPEIFVHPEVAKHFVSWARAARVWPFSLEPGRFARNPFNTCDCYDCDGWKRDDPRRTREKRQWRREAWAEADDAGERENIADRSLK